MTEKSEFESEATARHYAAARPDYPDELFATLDGLIGGRLAGAHVVDVAAGTGIAARRLAGRGARVTAVELSAAMLGQLAAASPGVAAVQGSGHALPLASGSADLVTYAQAWHWMDPGAAGAEAKRVLRPGGVLAAWWNLPDYDVAWLSEQEDRISAACPDWHRYQGTHDAVRDGLLAGAATEQSAYAWQRTIPLETHLANLASKSYIADLGDAMPAFLDREREILAGLFPDGRITEHYRTVLLAARTGEA
jgi:SAM-dependent methyltransferase